MTPKRWAKSEEAKKAGWFSRRHETSKEHEEATARYKEKRGPQGARQKRGQKRG